MDLSHFGEYSVVDQIKIVSNLVTEISTTLRSLGITSDDPCSAESLSQAFTDWWEALSNEVKDWAKAWNWEWFGSIFVILADILLNILGAAALVLLNAFMSKVLGGYIVGAIVSAATFFFTSVAQFQLFFQYLIILELNARIHERITLGTILIEVYEQLEKILTSFLKLYENKSLKDVSIQQAYSHVKQAKKYMGMEISRQKAKTAGYDDLGTKTYNSSTTVNKYNLKSASDHLELSVDHLTNTMYGNIFQVLKEIHIQHGITLDPFNINWSQADPFTDFFNKFSDYFKKLYEALREKFFLATDETRRKENIQLFLNFIGDLGLALPDIIRQLLYQSMLASATKLIFKKMPVSVISLIDAVDENLTSTWINYLTGDINKLNDLLGNTYLQYENHWFFKNEETKNITYRDLNTTIKYSEALLLLLPVYWDSMNGLNNLMQDMILSAYDPVNKVSNEMKEVLLSKNQLTSIEIDSKKFGWCVKLIEAKSILDGITGDSSMYTDKFSYDPMKEAETTALLNATAENIKKIITNKNYNIKKKTLRTPPGEIALRNAQSYLSQLVFNILLITSPTQAKKILSSVKSIKLSLISQLKQDRIEGGYCAQFVELFESTTLYKLLKPPFDRFMESLQSSKAGKELYNALRRGDVTALVSILNGIDSTASLFTGAGPCENKLNPQETIFDKASQINMPGVPKVNIKEESEKLTAEAEGYKNKFDMAKYLFSGIFSKLQEAKDAGAI